MQHLFHKEVISLSHLFSLCQYFPLFPLASPSTKVTLYVCIVIGMILLDMVLPPVPLMNDYVMLCSCRF